MALTTRNQRFALLSAGRPFVRTLPEPSAAFDTAGERQQLLYEAVLGPPAESIPGVLTATLDALNFVGSGVVAAAGSNLGTLSRGLAPLAFTGTGKTGANASADVLLGTLTCTAAGLAPLTPLFGQAHITLGPVVMYGGLAAELTITLDAVRARGRIDISGMPMGPRHEVRVIRRRAYRW